MDNPQLPLELVAAIMRRTSPEDLRNMAAACRQYKSTAYQQAGLCISVCATTILPPDQRSLQKMATCRDVVRHAAKHGLRVELDFSCHNFNIHPLLTQYTTAADLRWVADMCACVTEALPVLVKLSVGVPEGFRARLDMAMRHPAPHLHTLCLGAVFDIRVRCAPSPTATIFGGAAPKLTRVELHGVVPGNVAIPAFAAVHSVELGYPNFAPHIRISTAFPAVRHLELARGKMYDAPAFRFDLRGLALHKLTLRDHLGYPILQDVEPLAAEYQIPIVVHDTNTSDWCRDFWPTVPGNLSMRIRDVGEDDDTPSTVAMLVSAGREYMRVFDPVNVWGHNDDSDSEDEDGILVSGLEFLSARFAYIRLDRKYLKTIFKFTDGLPVLRRLQIDLSDDLGLPVRDSVCAPCPMLEDLVLFATGEGIRIRCDEITALARALGLDKRQSFDAALTLEGVDFASGENSSTLASVFPQIVLHPFSGRWSSKDQESGFWEY